MDDQTITNIKARIAQCRRLASSTTDERTAVILRQMADEGEADLRRLAGLDTDWPAEAANDPDSEAEDLSGQG